MWEQLPDLLLEPIFAMLNMRERYYSSLTCRNWNRVFYSPRIWHDLTVGELSFTHCRFNMYTGYRDDIISSHRVQLYLSSVGRHVRHITILPISNFYNLHKFLSVMCSYFEFFDDDYPMPKLHRFDFGFSCETRSWIGPIISGTGGKLLEEFKRLLRCMKNLETLTLTNLLLDNVEASNLLQDVISLCRESLHHLVMLNCTKARCPLYHVGMFPNLKTLVISPLQLTDDVVLMLAESTSLANLTIVQDKYSLTQAQSVSSHTWWEAKQLAPKLRVRLEVRGRTESDIVFQENAPVWCVVYDTPYAAMSAASTLRVADLYRGCLEVYAYVGLPRKHGSRTFHERGDSYLVLLTRECRRLSTLVIRQRVSTATLLLVASVAKQLKEFHVRKNAVLQRCDWPRSPDWTDDHYEWLRNSAASYTTTETEVGVLLGGPWRMLSDAHFKTLTV